MSTAGPERPSRSPARRRVLLGGVVAAVAGLFTARGAGPPTPAEAFEVTHTDQQWRDRLTPEQYDVLRDAGTERPFSSPLNDEHRDGTYGCAGCGLDLYSSDTRFSSGTGWPSFWAALDGAVVQRADWSMLLPRTEVRCRRCGGHLGHVFHDGPPPTGRRYCMNGAALTFRAT
jgi:peptide-methionine (R)-S-oxide reductase